MPSHEAPELDRIERWMHSVVTHPQGAKGGVEANPKQALEQTVLPSDELNSLERISIYANMYFWRLNEVISHEYPTVSHILGEDLFYEVVKDYAVHHPSTHYNLNRLSVKFPDYLLTEAKDIPHREFVAAVATVERAMEDMFDMPHVERIPMEALQDIPDDQWANIRLQINPALCLFELDYSVNEYMTAVRENRQVAHIEIPQPEKTFVVIYRSNYTVWRQNLDLEAYILLSKLKDGDSLGEVLEACVLLPDVDMQKLSNSLVDWFKEWATQEFFCGVTT